MSNKIVDTLNECFKADPAAMRALICNRVPCNLELANHPTVQVGTIPGTATFEVGFMGVLNGILASEGLPLVAVKFYSPGEDDSDEYDINKHINHIVGFCEYVPPRRGFGLIGNKNE